MEFGSVKLERDVIVVCVLLGVVVDRGCSLRLHWCAARRAIWLIVSPSSSHIEHEVKSVMIRCVSVRAPLPVRETVRESVRESVRELNVKC